MFSFNNISSIILSAIGSSKTITSANSFIIVLFFNINTNSSNNDELLSLVYLITKSFNMFVTFTRLPKFAIKL